MGKYQLRIFTNGRGNNTTFGLFGDNVGEAHNDAERLIEQWQAQGYVRKLFRFIPWTSINTLEVEETEDESA